MNTMDELWFFTFGSAHMDANGNSLAKRYVVIKGGFWEARQKILTARGDKWGFQYPISERMGQVLRWNLTELTLEEVTLPGTNLTERI